MEFHNIIRRIYFGIGLKFEKQSSWINEPYKYDVTKKTSNPSSLWHHARPLSAYKFWIEINLVVIVTMIFNSDFLKKY